MGFKVKPSRADAVQQNTKASCDTLEKPAAEICTIGINSTSNVIDRLRVPKRQSTTFEVVHRHEKLAPESGVEFRPMAPISVACVRDIRCNQAFHPITMLCNSVRFQ